jgi:hypothetical protein
VLPGGGGSSTGRRSFANWAFFAVAAEATDFAALAPPLLRGCWGLATGGWSCYQGKLLLYLGARLAHQRWAIVVCKFILRLGRSCAVHLLDAVFHGVLSNGLFHAMVQQSSLFLVQRYHLHTFVCQATALHLDFLPGPVHHLFAFGTFCRNSLEYGPL